VGFVAIVFKVNTLMREVIDPAMLEHLHVRIQDRGYRQDATPLAPSAHTLMYDSRAGSAAATAAALEDLTVQMPMVVGMRQWQVEVQGHAGSRYTRAPWPVVLIGIAGVIISALIAALLVSTRRMTVARHGLEYSLAELERQKLKVEQARADLAALTETLKQAQTNLLTSEKWRRWARWWRAWRTN
jgi:CHASE1-domain containing sensor protein